MKIGVIIVVVLYELITIGGVGYYISRKNKQKSAGEESFALGGRSLGTWAIGTTFCWDRGISQVRSRAHSHWELSRYGTLWQMDSQWLWAHALFISGPGE